MSRAASKLAINRLLDRKPLDGAAIDRFIERHGASAYCLCQLARAIERAITHPKIGDAARDKRARRALAGFTRAQHKHFALA